MRIAIEKFYKDHNPSKLAEIDDILEPYIGEEIVMLRILCNKYEVTRDEMQQYLDQSKISSPAFENVSKIHEDYWDLNGVDMTTVVSLFYKSYCPGKAPRLQEIERMPISEANAFLLQLCSNYSVHPDAMDPIIESARKVVSQGTKNIAPKIGVASRQGSLIDQSRNDDTSSVGSAQNSIASTGRHRAPPPPPPAGIKDSTQRIQPPAPTTKVIEVDHSILSTTPRDLRIDVQSNNSLQEFPTSDFQSTESAKLSDSEPSTRQIPIAKFPKKSRAISRSRSSTGSPDFPSLETTREARSSSPTIKKSYSYLFSESSQPSSVITSLPTSQPIILPAVEPPLQQLKKVDQEERDGPIPPIVTKVFSDASAEIDKMKSEMEITRQQLKEVCMESQAVLKILKDNSIEIEKSKTATTARSSVSAAAVVAPIATTSEREEAFQRKLKEIETENTRKCDILVAQNNLLQQRNEELTLQLSSARNELNNAVSDRKDLLELIDVVSSAANNGINFNSILEAYLVKLGMNSSITTNYYGAPRSVGAKIADALEWKRSQKQNGSTSKATITPKSPSLHGTLSLNLRDEESEIDAKGHDDESEEFKSPFNASSAERSALQRLNVGMQKKGSVVIPKDTINSSSKVDAYFRHQQLHEETDSEQMDMQYELAKKAQEHAVTHAKLTARLAGQNLALYSRSKDSNSVKGSSRASSETRRNTNSNEKGTKVTSSSPTAASLHYQQPLKRQEQPAEAAVTDWKECFDPRTNRRYFYSPTLKKSVWHDPSKPRSTTPRAASSSSANPSPVRGLGKGTKDDNIRSVHSSDFLARSNNSSRQNSPAPSSSFAAELAGRNVAESAQDVWVMALDAKSNRYYWYNRRTKVSTWRKPVLP